MADTLSYGHYPTPARIEEEVDSYLALRGMKPGMFTSELELLKHYAHGRKPAEGTIFAQWEQFHFQQLYAGVMARITPPATQEHRQAA